MTEPQRAALRMLLMRPCNTTKRNGDGVIGGRTAACLERMGYARCERSKDDAVLMVHITEAGQKALANE